LGSNLAQLGVIGINGTHKQIRLSSIAPSVDAVAVSKQSTVWFVSYAGNAMGFVLANGKASSVALLKGIVRPGRIAVLPNQSLVFDAQTYDHHALIAQYDPVRSRFEILKRWPYPSGVTVAVNGPTVCYYVVSGSRAPRAGCLGRYLRPGTGWERGAPESSAFAVDKSGGVWLAPNNVRGGGPRLLILSAHGSQPVADKKLNQLEIVVNLAPLANGDMWFTALGNIVGVIASS
jgi:hypothetical protein